MISKTQITAVKMLKYAGFVAWGAMLIGVMWFAFKSSPVQLGIAANEDKAMHLITFAALTVPPMILCSKIRSAAHCLIFLCIFGVFIEALQSALPTRSAQWLDLLSNGVGIAIGCMAGMALRKLCSAKFPQAYAGTADIKSRL